MRTRLSPSTTLHTSRGQTLAFLGALLALVASVLVGLTGQASARPASSGSSAGCSSAALTGPSRVGNIGGIARPTRTAVRCAASSAKHREAPYGGTPPLLNHGGPVMSTQTTGDKVVVTPIFWEPSGFAMTASYKNVITAYLQGIAADSGKLTNVFSSYYQYAGSNGLINYKLTIGAPIDDTTALPADGCTLEATDTTNIYADNTGYSNCLDDAQISAETAAVAADQSLPSDLGHMYVIFLPKHVESCFNPGSTLANNFCTLNHQPTAAYCAYHSFTGVGSPMVYANMPFPAYTSGTGFSCTKESLGGGIQSPNGDTDADVEVSPLSHEMNEAITDPELNAWYDSTGNENGDDCAYIYGTLSGTAGAFYNQTVNGLHYLTQEEFSNKDFVPATSGCIQHINAVKPGVKSLSKSSGSKAGGNKITITGSGFPGATKVHFGKKGATFTVLDAKHIRVTVPAHKKGTVDITVTTAAGTSTTKKADRYTFK